MKGTRTKMEIKPATVAKKRPVPAITIGWK